MQKPSSTFLTRSSSAAGALLEASSCACKQMVRPLQSDSTHDMRMQHKTWILRWNQHLDLEHGSLQQGLVLHQDSRVWGTKGFGGQEGLGTKRFGGCMLEQKQ